MSISKLSIIGVTALIGVMLFTHLDHTDRNRINAQQASEKTGKAISIVSAGDADMIIYSTLEEVEESAELIVEVELVGKRARKNIFLNSMVIESYGLAKVKVNQVYKGDVQVGDELTVAEPGYFDVSGKYVSFEGYKAMDKEGRYILFLRTGSNNEQIVIGLYQGKFDLTLPQLEQEMTNARISVAEFDERDYVGDSVWQFNKLKQQVLEKYGD